MEKEIRWHRNRTISKEFVSELECIWKIKFPEKYISIVTKHDSAQPEVKDANGEWKDGIINIKNWRDEISGFALLEYSDEDIIEETNIFRTHEVFKGRLSEPEKIFPFAISGCGDLFLFDYRKNINEPSIVFLDHEEAYTEEDYTEEELEEKTLKEWLSDNLYYVCDSFDELLNMMMPYEE